MVTEPLGVGQEGEGRRAAGQRTYTFVDIFAGAGGFTEGFLLADDMNSAVRALRDVVRPPPEYLRWRWPKAQSNSDAWWQHVRHFVGQVAGRSPAPARRSPTASKPSR